MYCVGNHAAGVTFATMLLIVVSQYQYYGAEICPLQVSGAATLTADLASTVADFQCIIPMTFLERKGTETSVGATVCNLTNLEFSVNEEVLHRWDFNPDQSVYWFSHTGLFPYGDWDSECMLYCALPKDTGSVYHDNDSQRILAGYGARLFGNFVKEQHIDGSATVRPPTQTIKAYTESDGRRGGWTSQQSIDSYWSQFNELVTGEKSTVVRPDRCEERLLTLAKTNPSAIEHPVPSNRVTGHDVNYKGPPILKSLDERSELPKLLTDLGLTGAAAELGVFQGSFSQMLLGSWGGGPLHLVDTWGMSDTYFDDRDADLNKVLDKIKPYDGRFKILRNTTIAAASLVENDSLDFIYIDATHTYQAARVELMLWWPKLKVGGIMAGHDYASRNVGAAEGVSWYRFGVRDAVDEFASIMDTRVYSTRDVNKENGTPNMPSFYMMKC